MKPAIRHWLRPGYPRPRRAAATYCGTFASGPTRRQAIRKARNIHRARVRDVRLLRHYSRGLLYPYLLPDL